MAVLVDQAPRGRTHGAVEACHWADGYPLNVLLYCSLLDTIFDLKECTVVLDEVDEFLELIKKTWQPTPSWRAMTPLLGLGSPARVSQPLTGVLAQTLRLEVEEGGRTEHTHITSTSIG